MVPSTWARHCPAPSQVPSSPQVDLSSATQSEGRRGFPPAGVGVHLPSAVGRPHDRQSPLQAVSQQTPSAQNPLSHCVPQVQGSPSTRLSKEHVAAVVSGPPSRPPGLSLFGFEPALQPTTKARTIEKQAKRATARGALSGIVGSSLGSEIVKRLDVTI